MIRDIDKVVHEPARLELMIYLYSVEKADFTFLRNQTGLTQGNLSSHLAKLETAGYIVSEKAFRNKRPVTMLRLSDAGRHAFRSYVSTMNDYFRDLVSLLK